MRTRYFALVSIVFLAAIGAAAQPPAEKPAPSDDFIGTWSGTWDGAGSSGGFELTLEKGKDGALGGNVSVTGEPTYKATLKTVSFDGKKMTANYDFPPADGAEVKIEATFDGNNAKGTWSLRDKASGSEVVSGGWTVTKRVPSAFQARAVARR